MSRSLRGDTSLKSHIHQEVGAQSQRLPVGARELVPSIIFYLPCNQLILKEMCAKLLQLCPTLCDPMDWSLPGSSVHGILQARILEWIAKPSSRASSQPRF